MYSCAIVVVAVEFVCVCFFFIISIVTYMYCLFLALFYVCWILFSVCTGEKLDPHNANRGFFFSHVGWLMSRKHPKVIEYGKKIDMSDLEADNYIMFQKE